MNKLILAVLLSSLIAGCGGGTKVNLRSPQQPHPYVDCRPFPKPTPMDLSRQKEIRPESAEDHWRLAHGDYLAVYTLNKKLIAFMKEARIIASYWFTCYTNYNISVAEMNRIIGINNAKEQELLNRKPPPSKWKFWK